MYTLTGHKEQFICLVCYRSALMNESYHHTSIYCNIYCSQIFLYNEAKNYNWPLSQQASNFLHHCTSFTSPLKHYSQTVVHGTSNASHRFDSQEMHKIENVNVKCKSLKMLVPAKDINVNAQAKTPWFPDITK